MEGAGVKECRCGGAEAAAFVEIVKADGPVFTILFLSTEEAHGNTHPEELRCLKATLLIASLIDDKVAIIEGLNTEVVEVEVRCRIKCRGEFLDIVFCNYFRGDTLNFNPVIEIFFKCFLVSSFKRADAIGEDIPIEDLFVDEGEKDTASELGKICVFLDE